MINIIVPQINENNRALNTCGKLIDRLMPVIYEEEEINLSFKGCSFIAAEGIAILAGIKFLRDSKGLSTLLDTSSIKTQVSSVLKRTGFFDLFNTQEQSVKSDSRKTTLPIFIQRVKDEGKIIEYIDKEILERQQMPKMSEVLKKEIRKAIFEIFGNVFYHSDSEIGCLVCGQIFPNHKIIQIVFYDTGVGIAQRVRTANAQILSDKQAIEWAMERGNSTLTISEVPRGLGLFIIRKFIEVNEGLFRIYANNGLIHEHRGRRRSEDLRQSLKGTLIDLRIRIKDDIKYTLFSDNEV